VLWFFVVSVTGKLFASKTGRVTTLNAAFNCAAYAQDIASIGAIFKGH